MGLKPLRLFYSLLQLLALNLSLGVCVTLQGCGCKVGTLVKKAALEWSPMISLMWKTRTVIKMEITVQCGMSRNLTKFRLINQKAIHLIKLQKDYYWDIKSTCLLHILIHTCDAHGVFSVCHLIYEDALAHSLKLFFLKEYYTILIFHSKYPCITLLDKF